MWLRFEVEALAKEIEHSCCAATDGIDCRAVATNLVIFGNENPNVSHRAMQEKEQPAGGPHFVGKKDELIAAKRSCRTLEGRDVLIVHQQGVFYALDSYCHREYRTSCAELEAAAAYGGGIVDERLPSLKQ